MGQTIMSQMQIFNKPLNTKKYGSLGGNFYKIFISMGQTVLSVIQFFLKKFSTAKNV